ncbi:MAG: Dabb family protein [Roseibacillus sp.]|jgi:quinol monooxygenase YgiN
MKTILVTLALVITAMSSAYADHHEKSGPYRHVVCFKFKDDATKEQVASIEKAFTELSRKVDTVTGYEWGTNVSPENHAQGFTHCFIVTFKDKKGLDVYLPHKAHKAFVEKLLPSLDKVFVIDFVAQGK